MMIKKKEMLNKIKDLVQQVAPDAEVYLYGSHARGEGSSNSDWDVLILVDRDQVDYAFEKKITYPLYDLEFATGEIISPMVYSKQAWYSKHRATPFFEQIAPDLVAL